MRITGGIARGIPLQTGRRTDVRPATDMMRQAVFSSLGPRVETARCLDLFAGTGAYGLEALSRGAASVRFVEQEREAVAAIAKNIQAVCKSMGADAACAEVEQRDVFTYKAAEASFDIVFADPPYAMLPQRAREITRLAASLLVQEGLLIFEMPGSVEVISEELSLMKRLGKGKNDPSVCFFSKR